jgi:hypothetical protein
VTAPTSGRANSKPGEDEHRPGAGGFPVAEPGDDLDDAAGHRPDPDDQHQHQCGRSGPDHGDHAGGQADQAQQQVAQHRPSGAAAEPPYTCPSASQGCKGGPRDSSIGSGGLAGAPEVWRIRRTCLAGPRRLGKASLAEAANRGTTSPSAPTRRASSRADGMSTRTMRNWPTDQIQRQSGESS